MCWLAIRWYIVILFDNAIMQIVKLPFTVMQLCYWLTVISLWFFLLWVVVCVTSKEIRTVYTVNKIVQYSVKEFFTLKKAGKLFLNFVYKLYLIMHLHKCMNIVWKWTDVLKMYSYYLSSLPCPGSFPAAPGDLLWQRSSCAFCHHNVAEPCQGCWTRRCIAGSSGLSHGAVVGRS